MKAVLLACLWIISVVVSTAQVEVPVKTVTVCEVLRTPTTFNGQIISVRGVYSPWEHGLYLRGEDCEGILVTHGFKWPSVISIVNQQRELESRGRSIDGLLRANEELSTTIKRELQRNGPGVKVAKIKVTYTGLFETHEDLEGRPGDGFGALNSAPGQLYVESMKDIVVEFEEKATTKKQ